MKRILLTCLLVLIASSAEAQSVEATSGVAPVEGALELAQACHCEGTWRREDCTVIYHLARRKGGDNWLRWLKDYSALWELKNDRARDIITWPWGDIENKGPNHNKMWAKQRSFVLELLAGRHKDPCKDAQHWGGANGLDPPKGRMIPARCSVPTANRFYALRPR